MIMLTKIKRLILLYIILLVSVSAFLLYGLDWLGYAHIMVALAFIGPWRDPVKNIWVIQFGIIVSLLTLPVAFILGYQSEMPIWWSLIDYIFGIISAGLLLYIKHLIDQLEAYFTYQSMCTPIADYPRDQIVNHAYI